MLGGVVGMATVSLCCAFARLGAASSVAPSATDVTREKNIPWSSLFPVPRIEPKIAWCGFDRNSRMEARTDVDGRHFLKWFKPRMRGVAGSRKFQAHPRGVQESDREIPRQHPF